MAIENANWIAELDANYPAAGEMVSEGDDHIRQDKRVLKNTFQNFGVGAPVTVTPAQINNIPNLAPKASPAFTGVPIAPAAGTGNGSLQLATMQDVQNVVANASLGGMGLPSPSGNANKFLGTLDGTNYGFFSLRDCLHVQDQKANGAGTGAASAGQNFRTINTTLENSIQGASVASDEVTLPAGTYDVTGWAAGGTGNYRISLYNTADSAYVASCMGLKGSSNGFGVFAGRFTIAAQKTFKVVQDSAVIASNGFGAPASVSTIEVYLSVIFRRLPS